MIATDDYAMKVVTDLFEKAVEDGIITDEESSLIQSIELEMESFLKCFDNIIGDGIITEEKKNKLELLKTQVLNKAEKVATSDGVIDEDEQALMGVLERVLSYYHVYALKILFEKFKIK